MSHRFTVRNYRPQDFNTCAQLNLEFRKPDAMTGVNSLQAWTQRLNKPGYRASKHLLVAEVDGVIVGYINITPELGIGRVVLDYLVHPNYSTGSIIKKLIDRAVERAKEVDTKVVHLSIPSAELNTAKLLSDLRFFMIRRFYELRLEPSKVNLETTNQLNPEYRRFEPGEEEGLAQLQNHCFADAWGYNPNTAEDIIWHMSLRNSSPDDIILAGDKSNLIGYCWTETKCSDEPSSGKSRGRIYMVGVRPGHRNRGIGKKLIVAGLSHLKRRKKEIIYITVDNQNIPAVRLYRSLGFELWEDTLWYEKIIE